MIWWNTSFRYFTTQLKAAVRVYISEDGIQYVQVEQLQNSFEQYQLAYQEMETEKVRWEQEVTFLMEQLEKSEGMRRRLNDQVTELQGQLALEEQRSKFCVLF